MPNLEKLSSEMQLRFEILRHQLIAETRIARVYKVQSQKAGVAALKVYRRENMGNEWAGVVLMRALDGQGCVRIYDQKQNAVLMEWLEGPALGDLSRSGADMRAAERLLDVACALHSKPLKQEIPLADLNGWFDALFTLRFSGESSEALKRNIRQAQDLAGRLLADMTDLRPLHGDLHYDNVRLGQRGYLAFDAKGILGDPAYELANAFRHPLDRPDLVRDPTRIDTLATLWATGFGVSRKRLLQWASVKCALSIAWRSGPVLTQDKEGHLLDLLLDRANVST